MTAHASKGKHILTGHQVEKLGCAWNHRRRTFEIDCSAAPLVELTPTEVIELGVELVLEGTKALTERPWR